MTKTAKPLWWRVGNGKWHEDPLTVALEDPTPRTAGQVNEILRGEELIVSRHPHINEGHLVGEHGLHIRRTGPPVAQQCQHCRAAKAKQRKVRL